MGKDYVTGKAQLAAALTARGVDFMQIRQSLNGQASFLFENGVVNGINIGQLVREGYATYKGEPKPAAETRQTDFAELRGTLTVQDGLVTNRDLSAKSPLLRVSGAGTAHLVTEKVNYRVDAAVVSTLEGQGGRELEQLKGLTVPIQITGTFRNPKFGVAIGEVLEGRAREALEAEKQKLQQQLEAERKKREDELKKRLEQGLQDKLKDFKF
jgi:AsmA protein